MIDTHVHLLDPGRYPYPPTSRGYVPTPDETGTLDDLIAVMDRHGVEKAVLVAASIYGGDNQSMLDAYAAKPNRFRIIAGVEPGATATVETLANTFGVSGIRLNLTDDQAQSASTATGEMLDAAFENGLSVAIQASPAVTQRAFEGAGEGPVILDHFGRPDLCGGLEALREIAKRPDTWLKLSAGFRIAGSSWPEKPDLIEQVIAAFPQNRLIWGSDWPFINVAGQRPDYHSCIDWAGALTNADLAENADALFWRAP